MLTVSLIALFLLIVFLRVNQQAHEALIHHSKQQHKQILYYATMPLPTERLEVVAYKPVRVEKNINQRYIKQGYINQLMIDDKQVEYMMKREIEDMSLEILRFLQVNQYIKVEKSEHPLSPLVTKLRLTLYAAHPNEIKR